MLRVVESARQNRAQLEAFTHSIAATEFDGTEWTNFRRTGIWTITWLVYQPNRPSRYPHVFIRIVGEQHPRPDKHKFAILQDGGMASFWVRRNLEVVER
jgi:hypothetical protein